MSDAQDQPVMAVRGLTVNYHHAVQVLNGLSLSLPKGQVTTLLGANGAGKTTLLKALSGLLRLENGHITEGRIELFGQDVTQAQPHELARQGCVHVREGRCVFERLSVADNLVAATYALDGRNTTPDLDRVYDLFPRLAERRTQLAGLLSGGEQQMLALARALVAEPQVILLDEPSLGLAPQMVSMIFDIVRHINRTEGVTILLVEQNAQAAFSVAHRGYIMENGRIVMEGDVDTLRNNEDIQTFYLGMGERDGEKSYRNVKHYKRRKRWLN